MFGRSIMMMACDWSHDLELCDDMFHMQDATGKDQIQQPEALNRLDNAHDWACNSRLRRRILSNYAL